MGSPESTPRHGFQAKVKNPSMAVMIIFFWDVTPFSLVNYNNYVVTYQKMTVYIVTAMRTLDFTKYERWSSAEE
jgi:hypothetical protein